MKFHKAHVILPLLFLFVQIQARREKPTREIAERRRDRDRDRDVREGGRDRLRDNERREDQIAIDSIHQYESVASPPPRYHSTKTPAERPFYSMEETETSSRYPVSRINSAEPLPLYNNNHNNNNNHSPRNNIRDHLEDTSSQHNNEYQHVRGQHDNDYPRGPNPDLISPHNSAQQDATEEMQDMRPPEPPKLLLPRLNLRHEGAPKFGGKQECQKCGGFTLGASGTCCKACGKLGYNKGCWCRTCDCLCYDT